MALEPHRISDENVDPDLLDAARLRARELAEGDLTVAEADSGQAPSVAVRTPAATEVQDAAVRFDGQLAGFDEVATGAGSGSGEAAIPGLTGDQRAQLEEQAAVRGVDGSALGDAELVHFVADAQLTGVEHGFLPSSSALDAAARAQLVGGDFGLETEGGKVDSGNVTIYDAAGRPVTVIEAGEEADADAIERAVLEQSAQTQSTEVDGYVADGYTVVGRGEDGSVLLQSPDGGQVRVHENGNVTVERDDPGSGSDGSSAPGGSAPAGTGSTDGGSGTGDGSDGSDDGSGDGDDDGDDDGRPDGPSPAADDAVAPPPVPTEDGGLDPDVDSASTPNPEDITSDPEAAAAFYDSPLFGRGTDGPDIRIGGVPNNPDGVEENPAGRKAFQDSPLGGDPTDGLDKTQGTGPAREDVEFGSGHRVIDPRDIDAIDLAAHGGGAAGPSTGEGPEDPLAGADVPVIGPPPIVGGTGGPVRAVDVSFEDVELDTAKIDTAEIDTAFG